MAKERELPNQEEIPMFVALEPQAIREESKYKNFVVRCNSCKSEDVAKRGWRKTQHRGKIQRWLCNNCNRTFTLDLGFWKMKNSENIITQAIDTYFENLSSRKVKGNLQKYSNTKISHRSVMNWVAKYSKKLTEFTNKLKPTLTGYTFVDETIVKCKKKETILWVGIDGSTKYIVNNLYSKNPQNMEDAISFFKGIKDKQETKRITSDGLMLYPSAFNKIFFNIHKEKRVEHKVINTLKTGKYNVNIERFFRNLKERLHLMYWFKSYESAETILNGYIVWYNFIREHMTLKKTPAEASNLNLGLGTNKIWGLITLSSLKVDF